MTDDTLPAKRKIGRPAKYSPALAGAICRAIAGGQSVSDACAAHSVARTTLYSWVDKEPGFAKLFAEAQLERTECWAEELLEIADNSGADVLEYEGSDGHVRPMPNNAAVQRDRLRSDNRKWLMGKQNPSKYGNTDRLELTGAGGGPVLLAAIATAAVDALQADRAYYAMKDAQAVDNAPDADGHRKLTRSPTPTAR